MKVKLFIACSTNKIDLKIMLKYTIKVASFIKLVYIRANRIK